ncbi:inositol polyphosphate phosphatase [Auricularia subglabra TFB-10046 SS5]|nr:inositol polyphosphate phosphatase [Auricularia subglabra TFB-10046 SS5]
MHLYLRDSPRTLLLVTTSEEERRGSPRKALVFRVAEGSNNQVVVEFLPKEEVSLSGVTKLTSRPVIGCLGLINVQNDVFLVVVTAALEIGNLIPSSSNSYTVSRILETAFFSLTASTFDELPTSGDALPSPIGYEHPELRNDYISQAGQSGGSIYEHPCAALTKIFATGTFYYASDPRHWDISTRLAERIKRDRARHTEDGGHDVGVFDPRFVWNENIVSGLLEFRERLEPAERQEFDRCKFLILVIQGYVGVFTVPLPTSSKSTPSVATLALISRLGWKRAGTRFNTRGVDDDGNTANFVETETLCSTEQICFSYTQVRGSVPLFWEQTGLQTFVQRIQITRSQAAAQPAFERHFASLLDEYNAVHIINLLGSKENEVVLSQAYSSLAARGIGGANPIGMTNFDFHHAVRIGGHDSVPLQLKRHDGVIDGIDSFGFTTADLGMGEIILEQRGVFRTNCLDCLDRTNFVQDIISKAVLEQYFMQTRPEAASSHSLWTYHRELWAENGDALSRIYAGTGALNTSYTRSGKRTLAGVLSDATKSVSRAYINNFQDRSKQTAIDLLLGNLSNNKTVAIFDPIHDSVRQMLAARRAEYSTTYRISMFVGTWNLNGRPPSESLLPWLFPRPDMPDPDIFVLGFQEMVPLTAQQIVQTDPDKRRMWEVVLTDTFERRPNKKCDYVLLRSEQLVGTALILFVKTALASVIRNVEATTRKTGLSGMAGNKGAAAIRFDFEDSSYCFITGHLAAGHMAVEERNSDYRTIVNGLHFLKGKTVGSHENVIWLADTNYRIELDNETVRRLAVTGEYDQLVAADQLKRAMDDQQVFIGFEEGPLLFAPTYRYDLHSTDYDTSEKMRIPAWTDRVLYRGRSLDLVTYSRAELLGSDHRPVFAIFRAEIRKIDAQKKAALRKQLLQMVTSKAPGENLEQHLQWLVPTDDFPLDLPPPSSADAAWWDTPDHPNGVVDLLTANGDSDTSDASPSSSDDELYNDALQLPAPLTPQRRPAPPPPSRPISRQDPSG